jgi:steroid delta-isomerase-like uncharacterized protein
MSEENKALARSIFAEVWGANDVNKVDKYFAANFVTHPELPGMPQGSEGVKAQVRMFASALSDSHNVIEDLFAEGDKVAIRWSATGRQTGEFVGIPATGKQFKTTALTIYRFKDGKAVEGWTEYNSLEMMQQLGVVPQSAPATG